MIRKNPIEYDEVFIKEKVSKLRELQKKIQNNNNTAEDIIEANNLAEFLIEITKNTYNKMSEKYAKVRKYEISDLDKRAWSKLLNYINRYTGDRNYKDVKLLDIGTGSGRDIKYASNLGFDVIGIDNSDAFITMLEKLEQTQEIPKNSFRKADMRNLPFDNNSFDVVRQQASLVHLPMITKGYTADKAIEENHRVLKENGLLYIFTKKGDGIQYVDTKEGLGGRIFQFYDENTIKDLVERNGFKILEIMTERENRNGTIVDLIIVIAQKN